MVYIALLPMLERNHKAQGMRLSYRNGSLIVLHDSSNRRTWYFRRYVQPSQREHGLLTLLIKLLEQPERLLIETSATLLIAPDDEESVTPPIIIDSITLKSQRKHNATRIVDGNAETA